MESGAGPRTRAQSQGDDDGEEGGQGGPADPDPDPDADTVAVSQRVAYSDAMLVEMVRVRENLFDKNRRDYKDEAVRTAAWADIANTFNMRIEDCQTRWVRLRERFGRELRLHKRGMLSASGKEWPLYSRMRWLERFIQPRNRMSGSKAHVAALRAASVVTARSRARARGPRGGRERGRQGHDGDVDLDAEDSGDALGPLNSVGGSGSYRGEEHDADEDEDGEDDANSTSTAGPLWPHTLKMWAGVAAAGGLGHGLELELEQGQQQQQGQQHLADDEDSASQVMAIDLGAGAHVSAEVTMSTSRSPSPSPSHSPPPLSPTPPSERPIQLQLHGHHADLEREHRQGSAHMMFGMHHAAAAGPRQHTEHEQEFAFEESVRMSLGAMAGSLVGIQRRLEDMARPSCSSCSSSSSNCLQAQVQAQQQQQQQQQHEDADALFARSLAASLRALPRALRTPAKMKMLAVLAEFEGNQ